DPSADRARPQRLTTIALSAWGVGVLVALGLARMSGTPTEFQRPSMSAALGQLRPADQEPAPLAIADEPALVVHQTRGQAAQPAPSVTSAGQAALPTPKPIASKPAVAVEAPSTGRRRAKRVFEKGIVAYVRCGGPGRARTSCLRDRKFEEQVWQTLAKLPSCSEGDPGTGSAELRWTLYKSDASALEWRPGADAASLNLRALAKCAGEKLASARTRLRAQQAVVSFRFSLK
ncbi:MAG TPA: hypothetical protein VJV78_19935, partial [Polyangiales bacterium]|nr:hypothetical protein [Polyangiales bacterium]